MLIEFNRDSVCMGDDCDSHVVVRQVDDFLMTSELLEELARYVPTMTKVVWAICSKDSCFGPIVGYIITDEYARAKIKLNAEDISVKQLFGVKAEQKKAIKWFCTSVKEAMKMHVFCRYYHEGSFTWRNGQTGELVIKYPESSSLLEKVMRECGV